MDELYRLHTEMDLFSIVFIRGVPISSCGGSILISVIKRQSGKLIRQPVYFHQRGKYTYSSARSPLRGTMPARLRMAS